VVSRWSPFVDGMLAGAAESVALCDRNIGLIGIIEVFVLSFSLFVGLAGGFAVKLILSLTSRQLGSFDEKVSTVFDSAGVIGTRRGWV